MDRCGKKDRLYNPKTKRCYKSCVQKNKVTHPITQKCRQHCKGDKIRRLEDFRCVKKTLKSKQKKTNITKKEYPKQVTPKQVTPKKAPTKKAAPKKAPPKKAPTKKAPTKKAPTNKVVTKKTGKKIILKQATPKKAEIIENREEEFIPPSIQKELKVNLKMFDKWMSKGFVNGNIPTIDYTSSDTISDIIQIYLHKKYKQNCPIYSIKLHSEERSVYLKKFYKENQDALRNRKNIHTFKEFLEDLKKINKRDYEEWDVNKFLKDLKLCLETGEKLIVIPFRMPTHLNMLFIKTETREIIRFEPHGSSYLGTDKTAEKETNTFLENLTTQINTYLELKPNRRFKYITPYELCPRGVNETIYKGFQSLDFSGKVFKDGNPTLLKNNNKSGFCALWSWFFAECVLVNPDIPIDEVYKEADKSLRKDPMKIATIIRGYFLSINDELKEMKEKYDSITGTYLAKIDKKDNFIYDYITESKGKLQKKPRKPFVGGVNKKYAFILPDANPDAKPLTS